MSGVCILEKLSRPDIGSKQGKNLVLQSRIIATSLSEKTVASGAGGPAFRLVKNIDQPLCVSHISTGGKCPVEESCDFIRKSPSSTVRNYADRSFSPCTSRK